MEIVKKRQISIVLPCLNEEKGIAFCIDSIQTVIQENNLDAEIIVVDNDSNDNSAKIVKEKMVVLPNLFLVSELTRGYGSAYIAGLNRAEGKYIFMADADGTYDFNEIPKFVSKLQEGFDMVVGNRFTGNMENGAMSFLHRKIGNPFLSALVKWFFNVKINDIHSGARALKRETLEKIVLYTRGMEFASEMIIKAAKANLKITELPISYNKRIGDSKLETFADGWRHLRFILLYTPIVLFLIPGFFLFCVGLLSMALLYFNLIKVFNIVLVIHPMFLSALFIMLGYQIFLFGGFAKTYAITHLGDTDKFLEPLFKKISIEKAGFLGILVTLIGISVYVIIFMRWLSSGFGSLNEIKNSIIALTFVVLGIQTIFSAFMLSMLGIKEK